MLKYLTLIIFSFCVTSHAFSQSVKRQSINPLGGSGKVDSVSIHHTSGQNYSTKTSYNKSYGIRPGFQQPEKFYISKEITNTINLSVFPNPASYQLTLSASEEISSAQIRIVDLSGKTVFNSEEKQFTSKRIDCGTWSNGNYIVSIIDQNKTVYSSQLIISK